MSVTLRSLMVIRKVFFVIVGRCSIRFIAFVMVIFLRVSASFFVFSVCISRVIFGVLLSRTFSGRSIG